MGEANHQRLTNAPMLLGGEPAVRVRIRYKDGRGLPIGQIMVGQVDAKIRRSIQYDAPAIVYFQRGITRFRADAGEPAVQMRERKKGGFT